MDTKAELCGLVLAGGRSRRMGRDKGELEYAGEGAAARAWRLLERACGQARVSVRAEQAGLEAYRDLPLIVDREAELGPAAGLLAAWEAHPERAWLVLAVDLPLVDEALLKALIGAREPERLATAYAHPDATLEPLCTIWEPGAWPVLRDRVRAGHQSLRALLEAGPIARLTPAAPERLVSVNRPEEFARACRVLGRT